MTARSFVWEKVALAASGAWVGTTAAWVICSIMTFLAARLPNGRGVGSTTTGAGVGARLALATLETGAAEAARGAEVVTVGTAALAAGCALDVAVLAGMGLTAVAREGVVLPATAGLPAGLGAAFAGGEAVFLDGAGAFDGEAAFARGLTGAFTGDLAAAFATGLEDALGAAFNGALATGFAALLAAGLLGFDTAALAAGLRPLVPETAGLADFADLVAGAFTTGLLSVPDGA